MIDINRIDSILTKKLGALWQLIKFNLVSTSVTLVQLLLANLLPLLFDSVTAPLPRLLRPVFDPKVLFASPCKYVVNGVVTYGYVLPFLLSNGLANIYGYFINMKATFKGKGTRAGFIGYIIILFALILFSTWLQGVLVARLQEAGITAAARTIAAMAAGLVQMAVLFPMEKYVLFKEK